ncbi:MAG: glycine cleavage system protein H [Rhodospirillales bacterium]|nr:MAG: glycine cleavage system protein H [Rhodospirillales bacterium]
MATVKGCLLPDDLLYDVANMLWYRDLGDGRYRVGGTMVAVGMAGEIVAATPRRADRHLDAGQACAVIESGKLVSPAKVAFAGTIVESNEDLMENPRWLNLDMYGKGWFVVLAADDPPAARAALIGADAAVEPFLALMAETCFEGCGAA